MKEKRTEDYNDHIRGKKHLKFYEIGYYPQHCSEKEGGKGGGVLF